MARSDAGAGWLRAVRATPVELDLFDPAMVRSARTSEPQHLMLTVCRLTDAP